MITDKKDSAFPDNYQLQEGLTKREYFAGLAMQGYLASYSPGFTSTPDGAAKMAVEYADALIKALNDQP